MASIDYFFSVLSPFAYLAGDELEGIARKHGASIHYRPFDILYLFTKTGGTAPKDRHKSRQAYRLQELSRVAKFKGMPINTTPAHWPTDPVPASCAIYRAAAEGGDIGRLAQTILRACWADELDIAEAEVIGNCLEQAGFPKSLGCDAGKEFERLFLQNTANAEEKGVFGSPTYVVDDQVFWGQDRLPYLDAWLSGDL
ncbi:MAG: 2-hydroxychromene-2-carboxylate isomerase [Albidovulum sp.]|nr:2-hydroxychromene-2-carboxylate isomerase [Albidovulum sp.]